MLFGYDSTSSVNQCYTMPKLDLVAARPMVPWRNMRTVEKGKQESCVCS
jgi:hypothetical protein